jgi:transposase
VATILLLETGLSCEKAALELGLSRGTVQTTKTGWLREKFDSLRDKARTGAPRKIKPQEEKMLLALANEKPLCATELLQVHLDNGGVGIPVDRDRPFRFVVTGILAGLNG